MSDTGFSMPKPGQEHKLLEPFEGTFRSEVSFFMGPGEPQKSSGTMVSSWSLNGLYLEQRYESDPNPIFPSFKGRGYWGYNFASQKYEGFWIDNVSCIMQVETGSVDPSGKTWEMLSDIVHPMAGPLKKRSIIRLIDQNHHEMETFMTGRDDKELRTMLIKYERGL
ncbi:MAG: DUF1579 family protein [Pirellulales bacterium]